MMTKGDLNRTGSPFYAMVDGRFRTKSIISHQIVIKGQSYREKLQVKTEE
jgi:hypothetical protein